MVKIIEAELTQRGYTNLQWKDTLRNGWEISAINKDGYTIYFWVDELVDEMIREEMKKCLK